jgi:hypothetical protein
MARARVVHPNFFLNEQLVDAERATGLPLRLAYVGLWTQADRMGRFEWRPTVLKLAILPWDACDFGAVLAALEEAGFIARDGDSGVVIGWGRWQPHLKLPSKVRRAIYERDGGRCQYCGGAVELDTSRDTPAHRHASIDHRQPRSRGGSHGAENLTLACARCNSRKGVSDRSPGAGVRHG